MAQRKRANLPLTLRGYIFWCASYKDTHTGLAPSGGLIGLVSLETAMGMTVRAALSGGFKGIGSNEERAPSAGAYLLEKPQT
jgi:hypothetical protein